VSRQERDTHRIDVDDFSLQKQPDGLGLVKAVFVCVAFMLAAGFWAISSPPGSSPDDDFHLASIWCANDPPSAGINACKSKNGEMLVRADVAAVACFARKPQVSGACTYDENQRLTAARVNNGTYPGGFYRVMNLLVTTSVPRSVVLMRLLNVAIAAILVASAIALARPGLRRAVALSWMVAFVPLTVFLVGSTNPSSWTISGVGTYWAFLITFLESRSRRRTALSGTLCVVSAAVAAASRADGAAYIVLSTLVVAILVAEPRRLTPVQWALPAALIATCAFVYLTANQSGSLSGFTAHYDGSPRGGAQVLVSNIYGFPGYILGMFGIGWGLGWFDTVIHPAAGALAWGAAFAVIVLSRCDYWPRKRVSVALVSAAIVALPLYALQTGGDVVGQNVQPRYLLPLVICGIGLSLYSRQGVDPWPLGPKALTMLVSAVGIANVIALQNELRRYVSGVGSTSLDLDYRVEWWWQAPLSPMDTWFLGAVLGVMCFAALAWSCTGTSREGNLPGVDRGDRWAFLRPPSG
jgi:hypothetical protein